MTLVILARGAALRVAWGSHFTAGDTKAERGE